MWGMSHPASEWALLSSQGMNFKVLCCSLHIFVEQLVSKCNYFQYLRKVTAEVAEVAPW
jgi:hypothetical protein